MLWTGYLGNGVPTVSHDGVLYPVRKLLLMLAGEEMRENMWYGTKCGCKTCVNPAHISRMTTKQHMAKMARKAKGSLLRAAKVQRYKRSVSAIGTQERADEIRMSNKPSRELAKEYGVSRSTICNIRAGKAWVNLISPFAGLFK